MNLRTSWMKLHHRPLPSTQNWPSISREVMIIASVQGWRSSQSNARKRRGRLCWSGWWTIYCDANRTKKKPRSKMATGVIVYQCKVGLISMTWHLLTPLPRERSGEERKIQLVTPPTTTKLAQEIFEQWRWVSLWYIKKWFGLGCGLRSTSMFATPLTPSSSSSHSYTVFENRSKCPLWTVKNLQFY